MINETKGKYIMCDCDQATTCPQGKVAASRRCSIYQKCDPIPTLGSAPFTNEELCTLLNVLRNSKDRESDIIRQLCLLALGKNNMRGVVNFNRALVIGGPVEFTNCDQDNGVFITSDDFMNALANTLMTTTLSNVLAALGNKV